MSTAAAAFAVGAFAPFASLSAGAERFLLGAGTVSLFPLFMNCNQTTMRAMLMLLVATMK
jgi:hypothetical protein